ncbi:hypothetical protein [Deefgea sp. CFH1-16]|uniref:hypothetical protein n=1 Tax=Deefgea sp. CFH1-16 TaxID=2675457 RepID=UPI0015F3B54F|nr:hypothetical protein [Deefgea sp. CFH1-16]MBM5575798.1 hypothetical protein [Deefgea sp. CFH1-16]
MPNSNVSFVIQEAAKLMFDRIRIEDHRSAPQKLRSQTLGRLVVTVGVFLDLHQNGEIDKPQNYIAALLGKSVRALRYDIRDLEAMGLIATHMHYDKDGMRVHNTYKLAPMLFLWRKGKQLATAALGALKQATDGATSRLARRAASLHNTYRRLAESNLLRGKAKQERVIDTQQPPGNPTHAIGIKGIPADQPPAKARLTESYILEIVTIAKKHGFEFAANCSRLTAQQVQKICAEHQKSTNKACIYA